MAGVRGALSEVLLETEAARLEAKAVLQVRETPQKVGARSP